MISFPWRFLRPIDPNATYTALYGLVQLQSITLLPTFIRYGALTERQLRSTDAVIGYRTGADPLRLHFFHLSAWQDGAAIRDYVHTQPHLDAMQRLQGKLGKTVFRYWQVSGSQLPLKLEIT